MSDIFISYAREDRAKVRPLAEALERHGWEVWWDPAIPTGRRFDRVIDQAMAEARCVVVVWTQRSVEKDWVLEEADDGRERDVLMPVLLEKVRPPRGFRRIQAAELFDWDGSDDSPAFQALVNDIAGIVGPPKGSAAPPAEEKPKPIRSGAQSETRAKAPRKKRPGMPRPMHPEARPAFVPKAQRTAPKPAPPQPKDLEIRQSPIDGLEYVWIPPGEFQMGAVAGDGEAYESEKPRHRVEITQGFWMARTPVTVAAYRRSVKAKRGKMPPAPDFNPKWEKADHPIVRVTWEEARACCEWAGGRLPSEAEWEYAARGGKEGLKYPWGDEISHDRANYESKKGGTTQVGSYETNSFELYDMAGNVWEWCADWFDKGHYGSSREKDPPGPAGGTVRVLRGGAWSVSARNLRTSNRLRSGPGSRYNGFGFRSVREVIP